MHAPTVPCRPAPWRCRALLLVLGAAALCGCTGPLQYVRNGFQVGPSYHRPPTPVAETWIDADDQRVRSQTEDDSRWWTVFNDAALNELIVTAYQQNLTLREAGFRVLQARAILGINVGELFPQQQFAQGSYTRVGLTSALPNNAGVTRFFSNWQYGANLVWELDFWGRFRRAVEAAAAELDASIEFYDDVLVILLADVADTYIEIRTLERLIELVRSNVALQRETYHIAQGRFKGGLTSELDVNQALSDLTETESLIPQLEIFLREANNRLCVLLGIPPEDLRTKLGPGGIPTAPPAVAVGIPADLLRRRPDVRRAERRAAAQSARIGVAVSELYPHFFLRGNFGWSASQFADLFGSDAFQGQVGPSFRWNLLNYGRLLNNIRLQDARFQELVVAYQNTVLTAQKEVEDGLIRFLRSQQRVQYLQESVTAELKAVQDAIAQYKAGMVDFNRVALVQERLVERQLLLAEARGEIGRGLVRVYRALGGGWQIRCDPEASTTPLPTRPEAETPAPEPVLPLPRPVGEIKPPANDPDKAPPPPAKPQPEALAPDALPADDPEELAETDSNLTALDDPADESAEQGEEVDQ